MNTVNNITALDSWNCVIVSTIAGHAGIDSNSASAWQGRLVICVTSTTQKLTPVGHSCSKVY